MKTRRIAWNKGKKMPLEFCDRVSASCRLRNLTYPETVTKRVATRRQRGYWFSEETKRKISVTVTGTVRSAETRLKLSTNAKQQWQSGKLHESFSPTLPERLLYSALTTLNVEHRKGFIRGAPAHTVTIGRKSVCVSRHPFDAVLEDKKTVIEVDGCYWHACPQHYRGSEEYKKFVRAKDRAIDQYVKELGWKMIRMWDHYKSVEDVVTEVRNKLGA